MTAVAERVRSPWHVAAPAIVSVATLIVLSLLIWWGADHPERLGSAYRVVMDAAVFARLGPVFLSGAIVYPAMRMRGASIGWAGLGAVASALVFGAIGALGALTFFPPLQAAYYALNPMVVGAIGSQIGWCALGEAFVRWRRGELVPRVWAWVAPVAVAGFALFYVGVVWDGGRHWFYVWIRGFMALFGTGQ